MGHFKDLPQFRGNHPTVLRLERQLEHSAKLVEGVDFSKMLEEKRQEREIEDAVVEALSEDMESWTDEELEMAHAFAYYDDDEKG